MSKVESTEVARNTARAAATHPQVLELRSVLNAPTATTPEKHKAQLALAALRPERKALLEAGAAQLAAAQARLSATRRAERGAAVDAGVAELRSQKSEQLEARRVQLEAERRRLKGQHRAVVVVLGEREAERRIADLLAGMGEQEKSALRQQLQVAGVDSAAKVGSPGAA